MNEWMTIEQLSLYLHIRKKTLYSMVRNGGIPSYKVGRMVRFCRSEIDEWMKTKRNTAVCRKIGQQQIHVKDALTGEEIKNIARETVASIIERNRKKQPDEGANKEKEHGTL